MFDRRKYFEAQAFEETIESEKIDKEVIIACCSDFHLCKEKMKGLKNLELISEVLDEEDFDYLLIPGDLINNPNDLKNEDFRMQFIETMKKLTHGKLTFCTLGEHDVMAKTENGFEAGDANLLKKTLKEIPNIILLDGLRNFSLNQDFLKMLGYKTSNINIVGGDLPLSFYNQEEESNEAFLKYWNEMINKRPNTTKERQYNILMLHALRNYLKLNKEKAENILPNLDLAVGGHYHNGGLPNYFASLPGSFGIITPQKELFKNNLRNSIDVNKTKFYLGGHTNYKVENGIINKLYGGPCVLFINLVPKQKENTNNKSKSKILNR